MRYFEVLHVEIAQKLQILKISLIFSNCSVDFQFLLKNHVSLKAGINSNSFDLFSEFFSQKLPKKWQKLKIYQKIAKNERKFQIW